MGWLKQSYNQAPSGLHAVGMLSDRRCFTSIHRQWRIALAVLATAGLLCPAYTFAVEPARAAADHQVPPGRDHLHRLSDNDLRHVAAQGFSDPQVQSDRLFNGVSKYLAGGNAVEVLGDLATLINPPLGILLKALDAETSFKNVVFNPTNPATISGLDGTTFTRLPSSIGELRFRHIHVSGSSGKSFGDVDIRNIDMGGTRIIVKRRQ